MASGRPCEAAPGKTRVYSREPHPPRIPPRHTSAAVMSTRGAERFRRIRYFFFAASNSSAGFCGSLVNV